MPSINDLTRILLAVVLSFASFELRALDGADPSDAADSLHRATMARASPATRAFIEDKARKLPPGPYDDGNALWKSFVASMSGSGRTADPNALVQLVLRESYLQTTKDLKYYAAKVKYFNDAKKAVRDYLGSLRELDNQMKAKQASDHCDAPLCARSADDLATLAAVLHNAAMTKEIAQNHNLCRCPPARRAA